MIGIAFRRHHDDLRFVVDNFHHLSDVGLVGDHLCRRAVWVHSLDVAQHPLRQLLGEPALTARVRRPARVADQVKLQLDAGGKSHFTLHALQVLGTMPRLHVS